MNRRECRSPALHRAYQIAAVRPAKTASARAVEEAARLLGPGLRLGPHCSRGSASRNKAKGGGASQTVRSQAEPGREARYQIAAVRPAKSASARAVEEAARQAVVVFDAAVAQERPAAPRRLDR